MKDVSTHDITIIGQTKAFNVSIAPYSETNNVSIYTINFYADHHFTPHEITLRWKIPAINVKGVWKPTTDFAKRIMDDWELDHMESKISVDSPIISVFGYDDKNIITFASSDAINTTRQNALYREEDNCIYCHLTFFPEKYHQIREYSTQIRIDQQPIPFSESIHNVGSWWSTFAHLQPIIPPHLAKVPVYSTWYQFHQKLDQEVLINECKIASELGYKLIILDDGWQTNDENRGYDFTGDWSPERIPQMKEFVHKIHQTGMKIALWYSVPFCGKRSKAYQKFKGKFLTEEHRWAPVFDPRYPEVRQYLIELYTKALLDWDIDGFKLDFIDEFKVYPDTILTQENGRDFSSVNLAVDRLMTDILNSLYSINPEIVIEFRQKYTGPAMRKYGNMFRAFDCPGDPTMNRVRIADIKMLCGDTAVHSDMITYHQNEPLEIKAIHITNMMFAVPQLSILLKNTTKDELSMIKFYTEYWVANADILLNGHFEVERPLANYPIMRARLQEVTIIGIYDNYLIDLKRSTERIDIINGQLTESIVIHSKENHGMYHCTIFNCIGNLVEVKEIMILIGVVQIKVPSGGLVRLEKNSNT